MYGLINRTIAELITNRFGEEAWDRILDRAQVDEPVFNAIEGYPDQVTYDIVGAASAELAVSADELLFEFGRHWVLVTGAQTYSVTLNAGGDTLPRFFANLPGFHARVALLFPDLTPPTFEVAGQSETSVNLIYRSGRVGLHPMVLGLFDGLSERFGQPITVTSEFVSQVPPVETHYTIVWQ